MKKLSLVTVFLFLTVFLNAESYEDIFYNANKLYVAKNYEEANKEYLKITNIKSSTIYYNLASSYFMLGDIGQSILWYEKALKLTPFDKESEATIEMHTGRKNDLKILIIFNYVFSFLFLIAITLFLLLLVLFFCNKKTVKDKIFKTVILFIFISLTSFLLVIIIQKIKNTDYIIIMEKTEIYKGNSEKSESLKHLSDGDKLKVLEEYESWYYVKNKLGVKGWVQKKKSEKI